jgi:hypothetical protein
MLRIKGLTKRYRTGDLALKGIDLDVPDGQVMAMATGRCQLEPCAPTRRLKTF